MSLFKHITKSNAQGDVGMAYAIAYFAKHGYTVCLPLTDSQEFDMIVAKDGKTSKIQVKTTRYFNKNNNCYRVNLMQNKKRFDKNFVDFLFILVENETQYLIPTDTFSVTTVVGLTKKYKEFIVV